MVEEPDVGEPDVEEPEVEEPEAEEAEFEEPAFEGPDAAGLEVEEPEVEEPDVEGLAAEESDVEELDVEELVREVELSVEACSDADISEALQALRSSVALAARRVMAIRPDGSENLEQIVTFEYSFNAKKSRTQVGTPVAIAFPTMRKLTGISF